MRCSTIITHPRTRLLAGLTAVLAASALLAADGAWARSGGGRSSGGGGSHGRGGSAVSSSGGGSGTHHHRRSIVSGAVAGSTLYAAPYYGYGYGNGYAECERRDEAGNCILYRNGASGAVMPPAMPPGARPAPRYFEQPYSGNP
jgi:hypothetical protein